MKTKTLPTIEDIYPLTIVKMRFGGRIVIFNAECDKEFIEKVQRDEQTSYELEQYIEDHAWTPYGIGKTINEAFDDFKRRTGDSFDYI